MDEDLINRNSCCSMWDSDSMELEDYAAVVEGGSLSSRTIEYLLRRNRCSGDAAEAADRTVVASLAWAAK